MYKRTQHKMIRGGEMPNTKRKFNKNVFKKAKLNFSIVTVLTVLVGFGSSYLVIRGVQSGNNKEALIPIAFIWLALLVMYGVLWKKYTEEIKNQHIKLQQIEASQNLMVTKINELGDIRYMNSYMKKRLNLEKQDLGIKSIYKMLAIEDHKKLEKILKERKNKMRKESIDLSFKTEKEKSVHTICTIKWEVQKDYTHEESIEISAIDISEYCLSKKDKEQMNSLYRELASSEEEIQRNFEELREKQEALKASEERYSLVIDTASMGIWDYDCETKQLFLSSKAKNIIGREYEEVSKDMIASLIHPNEYPYFEKVNKRCKRGTQDTYEIECRISHKVQGYIWVYIISKWVHDEAGKLTKVAGSITDINEKKKQEEKIKYIAYYDSLTGMPNKNYLKEIFQQHTKEKRKSVLIHLDVDNFKFINDSYGHEYGDLALQEIANKLSQIKDNKSQVSRIGADEFLILVSDLQGVENIKAYIRRLKDRFKESIYVKDIEFTVSFSAGIAIYPKDGETFEELLTSADTAMHKAKEKGKRKAVFFDHQFKELLREKIHLEEDLRKAIHNREFVLFYQPQIQVNTGKMKGFEALIRWVKPNGEMISPYKFIGLAEETGLIIPIGTWVIREACLFINRLDIMGYRELYVAVNISSVQLAQEDFVEVVEHILDETKVDATRLHIEITETILMESIETNIHKLNQIRKRGVVISLDDFGKGYSSLTYLKQLPINVLKIEKAFIDDILENNKKNITGAIINLGHELALEVVAEGVEQESQFEYLAAYNCDMIQGYLISRPIPEQQVMAFLENSNEQIKSRKKA